VAVKSATFLFGGMNNVADPATIGRPDPPPREVVYDECADIVNCSIDNLGLLSRRPGSTLIDPTAVTSSWGDGTMAFCVVAGVINSFNGTVLTPVTNSPTLSGRVEFIKVNDIVVFSDGTTIGCVSAGVAYVFSIPSDTLDMQDLEAWVKTTYPNALPNTERNIEIDAFKQSTLAGRCLAFYNGALYLAIDNFVYCTKTFDVEHMDVRYNVVAGFPAAVTVIAPVEGGLFVGTETETAFLAGNGLSTGFEQRRVSPQGVLFGSAVSMRGELVPALQSTGDVVLWASPTGICAGGDGGAFAGISKNRIVMPSGDAVAVLNENGGLWQYLLCCNISDDLFVLAGD